MTIGIQRPITPFTSDFSQIVKLLLDSFVPMKGVPLCLVEEHPAYFTTTTAATLLALHHIKALNATLYQQFHETLFWLRDNTVNATINRKAVEDAPAWDVSEGASVWCTSVAIWALLATKYNGPRLDEIKDAAIWLVNEQWKNNRPRSVPVGTNNLFLTSIVLHALRLVLSSPLHLSSSERESIKNAMTYDLQFIRTTSFQDRRLAYWKLQTDEGIKSDPTSTLCAIWALYEEDDPQDKALIEGGICYLKNALHGQSVWNFKRIVVEPPGRHSATYVVSFTPSFVIPLLRMGCNPFDDICFGPIRWLEQNRLEKGWGHIHYSHEGHPLSFTTAYALWAITNWHKYACISIHTQTEQQTRALKRRVNILLGLLIVMTISFLLKSLNVSISQIFLFLQSMIMKVLDYNNQIQLVITILTFIGISGLIPLLKFLDSRVFNRTISKTINKLRKQIQHFLYAQ